MLFGNYILRIWYRGKVIILLCMFLIVIWLCFVFLWSVNNCFFSMVYLVCSLVCVCVSLVICLFVNLLLSWYVFFFKCKCLSL